MIKFFALIPRQESVPVQEFHDHWRHPHASMGRPIPSMVSYVQSHHIPSDLFGQDQTRYEGIAETEFDTLDDALAFGSEPQYVDFVQPDEPNFVGEGLEWLYSKPEVIVPRKRAQDGASYADVIWSPLDRPFSIKMLQFIHRDGNPDWAEEDDAELGNRIGAFRHVRDHVSAEAHPDGATWLGARELWWPTLTAFRTGVAANRAAFDELIARGGAGALSLLVQSERYLR
ncbi:EthD domain-containing protein [Naasia lichenicola]|uniref:Ethyl tert-butyl ether degradation protein EthD n=1 Tax=Naasia lichenicola TaxID=2565933 RepID=A0A4S4FR90_9MICO|nr:EthD domain-containing protein [Naasia lichenicola]THG32831.1 ethyl tert-butyl ether degradation protein EthD [Naasia lichenicola]